MIVEPSLITRNLLVVQQRAPLKLTRSKIQQIYNMRLFHTENLGAFLQRKESPAVSVDDFSLIHGLG